MERDIYAKLIEKIKELDISEQDIDELKEQVAGLLTDVSGLQTDVSGLQTDVAGLLTDVSGLQTDVSGLQTDVSELQTNYFDKGRIARVTANSVPANDNVIVNYPEGFTRLNSVVVSCCVISSGDKYFTPDSQCVLRNDGIKLANNTSVAYDMEAVLMKL